jgi:OmpA-OmpF porin, OOP family
MKNSLLLVCCLIAFGKLAAQSEEERWNVGVHGGATQYSGDLGQGFYSTEQAVYGFGGVSVSRYLTNRLDASFMFTRGQVGYLAPRDYSKDLSLEYNFRVNLSTANLVLRYNLRDRENRFVPFVFAGGSALRQRYVSTDMLHKKPVEFAAPTAGAGFNIWINPYVSIQFQEMFMYCMTDDVDYRVEEYNDSYLFHTLGLTFNLAKYRRVEARAGHKIDRCYEMRTGFKKKYTEPRRKFKSKSKVKKGNKDFTSR